ncbi:MAG TPA: signal peptidase II [Bacillota bacterium]|nr:signal peptidase II [Bacillota bacterium]HQE01136.1 signal peptidase II [Bacillota bacterium]
MKIFFLLCLGVLLLDRASKFLICNMLEVGQTVPIIDDVLHLTYMQNTGAAFGILQGRRWFLIAVAAAVAVVILLYVRRLQDNKLLQVAFALQLGGALGNLYDRIFYSWVVDFIDFRLINFAIFNIADSALVVGVILFALDVIREWKIERREA